MKSILKLLSLLLAGLLLYLPQSSQAQSTISGIITDSANTAIQGVSVRIKGGSFGTKTDEAGRFTISARASQTLLITSVGYDPLEVPVTASASNLSLRLVRTNATLADVVVIGYGTQKKENLTGAITSITSEQLESRPLTNLAAGLQGQLPGLTVNRGNGAPGSAATFSVRGAATLGNAAVSPLVLVDGVQMDPNLVNPDDVESVTVLKDAASAAIYGVRAANGVVLITTKNPKKNAPVRISYTGSYTLTRPTRMPDYMNSLDYITAHREADRMSFSGSGSASEKYTAMDSTMAAAFLRDPNNNPAVYVDATQPTGATKYRYVGNTNWIDVLYPGWAPMNQHTISASGGQGRTSFVASLGYFQQDGLMKIAHDSYQRFNPSLKLHTEATNWLDLDFKVTLNRSEGNKPTPASHGGLSSGWIPTDLRPTMPVYHPDGRYSGQGNFTNMVALATLNGRTKEQINDLFLTGGFTIKPVKNVQIVANYTWNSASDFYQQHYKEYKEYGVNGILIGTFPWSTPSRLSEGTLNRIYYSANAFANYENTFGGKHYLKFTVGYNQEYNHNKFYGTTVKNLIDQEMPAINLNNDPAPVVVGGNSDWALTGTFFRLNYIFDKRYLLEINGRYDGTSRYQRGDRYTFLPSASAGWRVSEERFFAAIKPVVNDLKIRASYGTLGNQGVIANNTIGNVSNVGVGNPITGNNYPYLPTLGSGSAGYIFGNTLGVAVNPAGIVNPNFTWEKVTSKNIGLDASLLRNRLTLTFDAYIRDTKDILAAGATLPAVLGTGVPQVNAASMQTKGWELAVGWRDGTPGGFNYGLTLNVSDYSSKITSYNGNLTRVLGTIYQGMNVGEIWGFVSDGYFETDASAAAVDQKNIWGGTWLAGDMRYQDLNKDSKITIGANTVNDPGDQKVIGNNTPRYQFGADLNLSYAGFDLSAFFQGVAKRDVWLSGTYMFPFANDEWDVPLSYQRDYWTAQNTNAYYARLRFGGGGNYRTQTKYLQNAAYVRMKNIALGYTVPARIISRAKLQRARIYVSGENLAEITNVQKGFDPELLGAQSYPLNRAVSFGLQIGL
jgi:TonB-linked SusC/RagA family outer membrane protein